MEKIYIIAAVFMLALSSCEKWLDINHDPNRPNVENIGIDLILTAEEYNMLNNHCNSTYTMQLGAYLTESGEGISSDYVFLSGNIMPQNLDSWWKTYYRMQRNLQTINEKATKENNFIFMGASKTLEVLNWQRMVDIWGDIPYTQACNLSKFPTPKFDSDADIYTDLLIKIDEAIANIEKAISTKQDLNLFTKADFFADGDAAQWLRMANTVKLRILMRLSNVKDVSADVAAIADKCLKIDEIVDPNPGYYAADGKMNIFYESYGWNVRGFEQVDGNIREFAPTSFMVDLLRNNNDPRLRVYVDPRIELGDDISGKSKYSKYGLENEPYIGVPFGQKSPSRLKYTCTIGTGILAGSSDKTSGRIRSSIFMTGCEVGFLLAEAALRGMIPGGDAAARNYYETSVIAAMKRVEDAMTDPSKNFDKNIRDNMRPAIDGTAEEAAEIFLSQDNDFVNWDKMGSSERKMEAICTQKWLNFFGYNMLEGWNEMRRTNLPKIKASNQAYQPKWIIHCPYPQIERDFNFDNLSKIPEIDTFNSLIFWDKDNPEIGYTELYQ